VTYIARSIDVTIQLGTGAFGEGGSTEVKLTGLRVEASVQKNGAPSANTAQVRVYGLTLSMMNQLSTMGWIIPPVGSDGKQLPRNRVTVDAGDAKAGMATVFQGTVTDAYADFSGSPDVPFTMVANAGIIPALRPVAAISFAGTVGYADIMQAIAGSMGVQFENHGVTGQTVDPYFPGTAWTQAEYCAMAGQFEWTLDNGTLSIWPSGSNLGVDIPEITPDNGLVGYPAYNGLGVGFRALFSPAVHFAGRVKLKSDLTPACGVWYVYGLSYSLASMVPGGPWFMEILGARIPGVVAV
jgi:hypothetical protein